MVILEKRKDFVACGIRAADVPTLLAGIKQYLPNANPLIDGRASSLGVAALLRGSHGAVRISLEFPAGSGCTLWRFDVYDPSEAGSYVSRSGSNIIAGVLYDDVFDRPGISDLTVRMPELRQRINNLPIDIVYTWVDSKDPAWRRAFEEADRRPTNGDAFADGRFHSSDELRYSLRSVRTYLPWAGTIHIVSNCSPPDWLDAGHARFHWVRHEEILDEACLPTFNSHAIEASLHCVPGVAENFLYFNDDFFALDALTPADFVNENGTLNANLEPLAVVNSEVDPSAPDYLNAARNGAKLLYERHGYYPTRLHRHAPYSLSRPLLEQLEGEFQSAVNITRRARFRSTTDISMASFLAHHYGFMRREVVYAGYPTELVNSNDPFFALQMRRVASAAEKPKIVCLNEGGAPSARWRRQLARFMAEQFPVPAHWERNTGNGSASSKG
ncbi:MAG TPA: stealth conserved region 3 domain-containing protein [Candidatus Binatia bacterium]|nr:stealth conserved region 3 domain-containing protein [Candidatus Binatia bacterium]